MFEQMLEQASRGEITPELTLQLLIQSSDPDKASHLFRTASRIRDQYLGTSLWWSAGISAVLPCEVFPKCTYCTYFTHEYFPMDALLACVKEIEKLGCKQLHLSGGTNRNGYDDEMLRMIQAIREISAIDIEVNLGPSFSEEGVLALKQLGIRSITSSLEVINEELFQKAKPGDSLAERKRLIEICEREGMSVRSMMMVGLGESYEDRIEQLFYLRQFNNLYHLRFSRFYPYPGTAYRNHPRCSPWELARTVAVARLVLPHVELGLAAGNSTDDIPLWYMAGGGNQLLGATVSRKQVKPQPGESVIPVMDEICIVNKMPIMQQFMNSMGRQVVSDIPLHEKGMFV